MASIRSVWKRLLGVERVVFGDWRFEDDGGALVVRVRPHKRDRRRCSRCSLRSPLYDQGAGVRRWRGLDLGTVRVFIEAEAPRVKCAAHGVVVAAVPWARGRSLFTREFEDQCAWLAVHTSRSAVAELMRVAWRTVTKIVSVVGDEARAKADLLTGLRRIGIDELSHRKGQKYVTVVVDHDTGRVVWMAPGRSADVVRRFFDELGAERTKQLQLVSADGANWIEEVISEKAPHAIQCIDTFHVVQWATKALDEVRRKVWNDLRNGGDPVQAKHLKNARWALWKNPENLTARQRETLAWIPKVNAPLYRAYLLKESLRTVFQVGALAPARRHLDAWISWATRSRLPSFVRLARSIRHYRSRIEATLIYGLTNALIEAKNTQMRLLSRIAHGFHHARALIGLAMLKLAGLCPPLPGRLEPTVTS